MDTISYWIGGGLSAGQLERLHRTALRVLDEIGVEVGNAELRRHMAGQSGVRVDGTRVRLTPDLVDRLVDEHRRSLPPPAAPGDEWSVEVSGGYCFQLLDPSSDQLRPMQTADCVRLAGLVDGLYAQGVRGGNPGLPQDVPPSLREVLAYKISLEHTREPGWPGFTSWENGARMVHMAEAAGQPIGLSVFVRDPLMVEGPTVDMAVKFVGQKANVALAVCAMPMMGVSAPARLPAAFVENTATVLGGFVLFKLLGADIGICPMVYPFDMKYGALAYGTPEHVQAWLISNQLTRYYNSGRGCWFCPSFTTSAIYPDAHSLTTRTAWTTIGALDGARHFGFAGWLGLDKIFSPEQLLLDIETVRYVRHLARPMEFHDDALGFPLLEEVGPRGSFLTHPSTLECCRESWYSPLFRNLTPEQAMAEDPGAVKDQIREMIRQAEAAHDFRLNDDAVRELDRLYREAEAKLT